MRTLFLTLITCLFVLPAYGKYSGGTGEPNDPYQIATAEDLMLLGETPEDYDKHFILTADIDLDPNLPRRKVFERGVIAAYPARSFEGVFDGNSHTISHLTIRGMENPEDNENLGLFGNLMALAQVKNIGLLDICVTVSNRSGYTLYIGGLVAQNEGLVVDSYSCGLVSGSHACLTGGLVGVNRGTVTRCSSAASVNSDDQYAGGLVGLNGGVVNHSYSTGTVSGRGYVGGLVGHSLGNIVNCYSSASVSGTSSVGGLVGYNGFVGARSGEGSIANCYSTGSVSGMYYVGGLAGSNSSSIVASYSAGSVSGSEGVGGLVGVGGARASFWDTQTSGQTTSAGGTGKTTAEMQDRNTFMQAGWDFVGQPDGPHDIWAMPEGGGYPVLSWQLANGFGLPEFSGGTGERDDPYEISRPEEMNRIGYNPRLMECHFKLVGDLDLTGIQFYPIGSSDLPYRGVFDGNDHTVSHLTIEGGGLNLGLFGYVAGEAEIKNIGVVDANIAGSSGFSVGALAGSNAGSITNSYSTGSVTGESGVGGLVGSNTGGIVASYSAASVGDAGLWVGGLVGYNLFGSIVASYSTGSVSGDGSVGGLVGLNDKGTVTTSYSTASVRGAAWEVGGLVGYNDSGSIVASYSTGSVSGYGSVGGLAGYNLFGSITNSYSTGSVTAEYGVGGLLGYNVGGSVATSYSSGAVSGTERIGGLVGNIGNNHSGSVNSCFWDIETSGEPMSGGGTGKATAEMQTAATFLEAGWDFVGETENGTEDIWKIGEGVGYPRLSWEKYSGGTGEPNNPYQIATAADLIALGKTPEDYDKHFILTTDIDLDPNLPGCKVFYSAVIAPHLRNTYSLQGTPFSGVFDGRGHKISHLTIKGVVYLGLFGILGSQAEVKDLGMVNVNIFRPSSMTGAGDYVGGLAGHNSGSVRYCYVTGTVSGNMFIGGLVGNNSGSVTQCYSTVVLDGDSVAGGLMGSNNGGNVIYCYSTGAVIGKARLGGLVGANWGAVAQCYSTTVVDGASDIGGLAGASGLTIIYGDTRSFHLETHSSMSCFWDTDTSGQINSAGGTGKSTTEMNDIKTYLDAGWDFIGESGNGTSEIWQMPENGGYPVLAVLNGYAPLRLQGAGTPENPYLISDAFELGNVVHYSPHAHYRLSSSIDLAGISWGGAVIPWFTGTFDGNTHSISHLTIRGGSQIGLFGYLGDGAKVENLGVVDVNIISLDFVVHAGSLAGCNDGTVIQCYSTGTISGAYCVGGLVGSNPGILLDCYSRAMVKGTNNVGGLTGRNCGLSNENGIVMRCYSTGTVSANSYFNGLMGVDGGAVTDSFWDIQTPGQTYSPGGVGKTTAEMQTVSTFLDAGWDFVDEDANGTEDIWWILEGQDYPRLWWEAE